MKKFIISLLTLVTFVTIIPDQVQAQTRVGYIGENPTTGQAGAGYNNGNTTTRNRFGHRGENPNANQNGTWKNRQQGTRANQGQRSIRNNLVY
jgi:hypothetical protein